jgi:hypothetical protein
LTQLPLLSLSIAIAVQKAAERAGHFATAMIDLVFNGKACPIPKKCVPHLGRHRGLLEAESYAVQSSVLVEVFAGFAASLKAQRELSATKENAVSLWFLAKEFFLPEVEAACATFSVSVAQFCDLFPAFPIWSGTCVARLKSSGYD